MIANINWERKNNVQEKSVYISDKKVYNVVVYKIKEINYGRDKIY